MLQDICGNSNSNLYSMNFGKVKGPIVNTGEFDTQDPISKSTPFKGGTISSTHFWIGVESENDSFRDPGPKYPKIKQKFQDHKMPHEPKKIPCFKSKRS